jgi:hypothetical protein
MVVVMMVMMMVVLMVMMVMMMVVVINDAIRCTNATEEWIGTHFTWLLGMKGPNVRWFTFISWYIYGPWTDQHYQYYQQQKLMLV